jgi:phytoene dehydrogenase-like protein
MVGAEAIGKDYADYAGGLELTNGAVIVRYVLDARVVEVPYMLYIPDCERGKASDFLVKGGLPYDLGIMLCVIDQCDPDLVPPGKQVVVAGAQAPAKPDGETVGGLLEMLEQRVFQIFPEVREHITDRTELTPADISRASGKEASGDVVGVAQVVGQVGRDKPAVETPVEGLYLVGCDAGARGIGTEQAAASAERVASTVLEKHPRV